MAAVLVALDVSPLRKQDEMDVVKANTCAGLSGREYICKLRAGETVLGL